MPSRRLNLRAAAVVLGIVVQPQAGYTQQQDAPPATTVPVQATPPPTASPPAVPAPATTPQPPAAAPSTAAPAPQGQSTAPAPSTGPSATPPAAVQQAPAPADGEIKLPDVEVIQSAPPPEPPKPDTPEPPKVVKKAPPPPPAEPEPAPVVAKPKPKPAPQKQVQAPSPKPTPQPQTAPPPAIAPVETATPAPPLSTEIRISPIGGSEIALSKVSGSVGRATAQDIQRTGAVEIQNVLQTSVPGVIVTDLQGNGFQTDVQYRGFSSSPVNGQPQGLAVYQNGVRINESFGDTVNWDFIPSNAINDITVVAGNPVFGLNAIGGAVSIGLKDGFNFHGTAIDTRAGSFGRLQGSVETGQRSGAFGAYVALEAAKDDGWRQNSPSEIKRMHADLGIKTEDVELHFNFTGAKNFIGAVTAAPVELLALDRTRTFTFPQVTNNEMKMASLNGTVSITDTLKVSGVAYRRKFTQRRTDGNILDATDCGDTTLCIGGDQAMGVGAGVNPDGTIPFAIAPVLGALDKTSQDAGSEGVALQGVEKAKLFGLGNQFLLGASYDHGEVRYSAASQLSQLSDRFLVTSLGIAFTGPNDISPRLLNTKNDYYGLYFSDTLDLTDKLSVTVGGRYNVAKLSIRDLTGNDPFLNADSTFKRFNPQVGATYSIVPGVTLFGSYSEANRAPTPAELACADPLNPCLIDSFLTADPPLKQVVSFTWEAGLRGESLSWSGKEKFEWGVSLFRTLNTDDIIAVAAPVSGRGFFQNAGDTLRQGVEASVSYRTETYFLYANYNFTDATYQSALTLASPNNPVATLCDPAGPADGPTCVSVMPGDNLPGIAKHKFKAGFDYWLTHEWKFGADVIATSSQVFFGDDGNQNTPLPGYAKVNLHTSYDINDHVQIYGLVDNLFDKKFATFGNFFGLDNANAAAQGAITFTDPRTVVPGAPQAFYAGLRIKF